MPRIRATVLCLGLGLAAVLRAGAQAAGSAAAPTVATDTKSLLASFMKSSGGDFAIERDASAAAEASAYRAVAKADLDSDGRLLYAEWLGARAKAAPDSVSGFDLAMADFLPSLSGFSLAASGGLVGSGTLAAERKLGAVTIPAGARIDLADHALLISMERPVTDGDWTAQGGSGTRALLRFLEPGVPRDLLRAQDSPTLTQLAQNPGAARLKPRQDLDKSLPENFLDSLDRRQSLEVMRQFARAPHGFLLLHEVLGPEAEAALARAAKPLTEGELTDLALAGTRAWFKANPPAPDGGNTEARRARSEVFDQLVLEFPSGADGEWFLPFNHSAMNKPAPWLREYPILRYLRDSERLVLEEVRAAKVEGGIRVWKAYNLGIIVKTPELSFAIDLFPFGTDYSKVLDFEIASHLHGDHMDGWGQNKLLAAGKKVFAPGPVTTGGWVKGMTAIERDSVVKVGPLAIEFRYGHQGAAPCLVTIVDCGPAAGGLKVAHTGEVDFDRARYHVEGGVDFYDFPPQIPWVDGQRASTAAVEEVGARATNFDHLLEFGHLPDPETFAETYAKIAELAPGRGMALTWGESIFLPAVPLAARP